MCSLQVVVGRRPLPDAADAARPALESLCQALGLPTHWDSVDRTLYINPALQGRRAAVPATPAGLEPARSVAEALRSLQTTAESVAEGLYRGLARFWANQDPNEIPREVACEPDSPASPLEAPPDASPEAATEPPPLDPPVVEALLLPEPPKNRPNAVIVIEPDPVIVLDPQPAHAVDIPRERPDLLRSARVASIPDHTPFTWSEPDHPPEPVSDVPASAANPQPAPAHPSARSMVRTRTEVRPFRRSQPHGPIATFTHTGSAAREKTTLT